MIEKFKREAGGDSPEKADEEVMILEKCFDAMFTFLQSQVYIYTNNINEYVYLYLFLYPLYTEPIKDLSIEEKLIKVSGPLVSKSFKTVVKEVCDTCTFMHLRGIEDISVDLQLKEEKKFQEKVAEGRMQQTQVGVELLKEVDLFDFRKINYLQTHKKNINFSYL